MILENDNIVNDVGYYGDKDIALSGHRIYFRKEINPDVEVKDDFDEVVGVIALTDETKDRVFTVEVVGVGDECGNVLQDRKKRKLHGWPPGIVNPIKKGDRLLMPDSADTLTHPYGVLYEGIISEFDVIAIIYDDEDQ